MKDGAAAYFIGAIIVFLIFALIFQICWNYVAPRMFKAPEIDYWTSVVFLVIVGIVGGVFCPRAMVVLPLDIERSSNWMQSSTSNLINEMGKTSKNIYGQSSSIY